MDHNNKKKRRPLIIMLDIVIIALLISGLFLILKPMYIHFQQDRLTGDLLDSYEQGEGTIVIDPSAWAVEGEDDEFFDAVESFGTTNPSETDSHAINQTPTPEPKKIVVTAIGRIKIPVINLSMPIAEGATRYNLRVAIGHYRNSAGLGQTGNSIFLGHRMYTYGRHFNRLGEVKIGDQIIIEDKENRYTYEVDRIDTVLPVKLIEEFNAKVDGSRIMLVTCTPVRVASHRLLVKGKLIKTEPLS